MEHPRNIIIASHILPEIEHLLSEVIIINKGEKVFYGDMDEVRDMMCKISGDDGILDNYIATLPEDMIVHHTITSMTDSVVIKSSPGGDYAGKAKSAGLTVSTVTPEDVCIYLTGGKAGDDIYGLWENDKENES